MRVKEYGWNILLGLDQLANTILFGYPDETLSARTYRKARAGQWFWRALRVVLDVLFRWESSNHCQEAFENEKNRVQCPKEYKL